MPMVEPDIRMFVDLDADDALSLREREELARRLEGEPALELERERLGRLRQMLAEDRVEVKVGFAARVLAALPAVAWVPTGWRAWRPAVAALVALATAASLFMLIGAPAQSDSPLVGAGAAVIDFFVAAVLSGAGLLAASWRGLGLALGDALGVSGQLVLGVGLVTLNGLLYLFLRGARRRSAESTLEAEHRETG